MDRRYEISQLFKLAFGVSSPVYLTVPIGKQRQKDIVYPSVEVKEVEQDEARRLSRFGTPIIFPMQFEAGDYREYDKDAKIITRNHESFWFPPATMVDFSQSKIVTRTTVAGGNGSVKEIFGFEDWDIRIRTLCITDGLTAREYEKRIIQWSKVVQSIKVIGDLFLDKDIHELVIENIDIKSLEGSPNVIPIELSCSSDESFVITHKK